MKKNILLFACAASLSIALTACSDHAGTTTGNDPTAAISSIAAVNPAAVNSVALNSAAAKDSVPMKKAAVVYTCKMHPEIISDKPGKCPKCGMELVKKEAPARDSTKH